MSTFGVLQDRIADEMDRDDLTSQIASAIKDAVKYYEPCRFWFNEGSVTGTTVTASAAYTFDVSVIDIDQVKLTYTSYDYNLVPRTFDWYQDFTVKPDTLTGVPTDYAVHGDQIYFYPTPDQTLTYTVYCTKELPTLSATADTNAWVTHGERMIRLRAMSYLYAQVLHEHQEAETFAQLAEREKEALERRTNGKIATNRLRPTDF